MSLLIVIYSLLFITVLGLVWGVLTFVQRVLFKKFQALVTDTDHELRQLFVFIDVRRWALGYLLFLLIVPVVEFMILQWSLPWVLMVTGALLVVPRFTLKYLYTQRRRAIANALPDALAQIAAAMQAGSTFNTACQAIVDEDKGPLGQEFGILLREIRLGARFDSALEDLGERIQSEDIDLMITAILIAQDIGGNLAEVLLQLSETLRRKLDMEGKIRALTSQGVLQGYVVTALPVFLIGVLLLIEPVAMRYMFSSLLGWVFLLMISLMLVCGGWTIRRVVSINI